MEGNKISIDDSLVKHVEVDEDDFCIINFKDYHCVDQRTAANRKGNITFDDMFMSSRFLFVKRKGKQGKSNCAGRQIG